MICMHKKKEMVLSLRSGDAGLFSPGSLTFSMVLGQCILSTSFLLPVNWGGWGGGVNWGVGVLWVVFCGYFVGFFKHPVSFKVCCLWNVLSIPLRNRASHTVWGQNPACPCLKGVLAQSGTFFLTSGGWHSITFVLPERNLPRDIV